MIYVAAALAIAGWLLMFGVMLHGRLGVRWYVVGVAILLTGVLLRSALP